MESWAQEHYIIVLLACSASVSLVWLLIKYIIGREKQDLKDEVLEVKDGNKQLRGDMDKEIGRLERRFDESHTEVMEALKDIRHEQVEIIRVTGDRHTEVCSRISAVENRMPNGEIARLNVLLSRIEGELKGMIP